jgi:hypothetical protein
LTRWPKIKRRFDLASRVALGNALNSAMRLPSKKCASVIQLVTFARLIVPIPDHHRAWQMQRPRSEGKRLWDRQLRNANSESERSIRHRGVRSRQYDALGGSGFDQLLRKILPMAGLECNGPLCCVE